MSRELKFRYYDKEGKRYGEEYKIYFFDILSKRAPYYKRFVIEQYTGLKDKNGKEIYEGDIVKIEGLKLIFVVKYNKPCAKFWMAYEGVLVEEFEDWCEEEEIEVIGNINENPELLEGE